jgi:uncharacterized protein YbjT (DUF2867 family)
MKITLTGSLGNTGKPLAEILVRAGHEVTIISSDSGKKTAIEALGANAAIGSVADITFLTNSFMGADAVYTMVPYNWAVPNFRQYVGEVGNNYAKAIKTAGIKRIVNLSSIGAHLENGTGPISGCYDVEHILDQLDDVSVKHLRAGIFFTNYFRNIGLIKSQNIMGNNYGEETRMLMVHPRDVAEVAASELLESFTGKSNRYVVSEDCTIADIVKTLGSAIGKPELPWIKFSNEQAFAGMTAAGMTTMVASIYVEAGTAFDKGILWEDYDQKKSKTLDNTKLKDFAKEFAGVYNS